MHPVNLVALGEVAGGIGGLVGAVAKLQTFVSRQLDVRETRREQAEKAREVERKQELAAQVQAAVQAEVSSQVSPLAAAQQRMASELTALSSRVETMIMLGERRRQG